MPSCDSSDLRCSTLQCSLPELTAAHSPGKDQGGPYESPVEVGRVMDGWGRVMDGWGTVMDGWGRVVTTVSDITVAKSWLGRRRPCNNEDSGKS